MSEHVPLIRLHNEIRRIIITSDISAQAKSDILVALAPIVAMAKQLEAQVEALKDKVANAYYQGHTDGRNVEKNPNPKDIVRKGRIRIDALLEGKDGGR